MTNTDMELVQEYAAQHSEQAFETLVSRHVTLVYSSALRQVRDPHLAEEVTQAVFIILSQKAGSLSPKTILPGWLYRTTRFTATKALQQQFRRQKREQEAYMQSTIEDLPTESAWQELSPLLDETVARLGQTDRDALVLRYFENKSLQEVGMALGVEERAAQKRVARGLEKLRALFAKRGIVLSTALIAAAISANSAHAVPVGLATTISATTVQGSAVAASVTTFVKGTMKMMTWMKLKFAIGVGIIAFAAVGATTVAISQSSLNGKFTVQEIAKKSQAAYAALTSYSDDGTVEAEGGGTTNTTTFTTRLQRPNLYKVEWTQTGGFFTMTGIVWSAGSGDFLQTITKGQPRDSKPQNMANMEMAFSAANGVSSSAASTVPSEFFTLRYGGVLGVPASGRAKSKVEPDEKVGDIDCFVISSSLDSINLPNNKGTTGNVTMRQWIGKQDYLIHKSQSITENAILPPLKISDAAIKNALAENNQPATPEAIAAKRVEMEKAFNQARELTKSGKTIFTQTHEHIVVNQNFSPSDFTQ
jgi:RNA polymerase sigma factor (sigma-70 family)